MSPSGFVLPDSTEMLRRLNGFRDQAHYQEWFYPHFLKFAGQPKSAGGIVLMLTLCIADYTKEQALDATMKVMLYMEAPEIIDALIDDTELAAQAKQRLETVLVSGAK